MANNAKSVKELGDILKGYIARSGKTQRQLTEEVGVPNPSYMSHMANGRVNWVESDYFRPLADALGLSTEEIAELKPELIVTPTISDSLSPRSSALSAGSKYKNIPRAAPEIPEALAEAARLYGDLPMYQGISDIRWQEFMTGASRKRTPNTIEGWLQEFTDLKRMGYDPTEEK